MFQRSGVIDDVDAFEQRFQTLAIADISVDNGQVFVVKKLLLQKKQFAFIVVDRDDLFGRGLTAQQLPDQLFADGAGCTRNQNFNHVSHFRFGDRLQCTDNRTCQCSTRKYYRQMTENNP